MRHDGLISILVLAAAGCSASGDVDPLDLPEATELPRTVDELTDERDPALDGGGYGILLFDTTSSMNTVRESTGNTRCYDAKIMARGVINDFFDPYQIDGDGIAIWGFTNNPWGSDDVQPTSTGYYTDSVSAIDAVDALSCEGSTPLADALCKGVNGNGETFTIDPLLDQMFVLTDGFENNSNGSCSGTSGSTTTPGTWQYKVMAQMLSTGIRVDTRYWVDPTILLSPVAIDSFTTAEGEPFDPSLEELQIVADIEELPQAKIDQLMGGASTGASGVGPGPGVEPACDVTCRELELFAAMALESGGTWGVVKDDDAQYPIEETVDPVTGPVHPNEPPPPFADADAEAAP
jgi:hypothetical protein